MKPSAPVRTLVCWINPEFGSCSLFPSWFGLMTYQHPLGRCCRCLLRAELSWSGRSARDDLDASRKQSALQEFETEPDTKKRTMTVLKWAACHNSLRLASSCLRTFFFFRTSSEQHQLDEELQGFLLAIRKLGRRPCLARLRFLTSSSHL